MPLVSPSFCPESTEWLKWGTLASGKLLSAFLMWTFNSIYGCQARGNLLNPCIKSKPAPLRNLQVFTESWNVGSFQEVESKYIHFPDIPLVKHQRASYPLPGATFSYQKELNFLTQLNAESHNYGYMDLLPELVQMDINSWCDAEVVRAVVLPWKKVV